MAAPVEVHSFLYPPHSCLDVHWISGDGTDRKSCPLVQVLVFDLDHQNLMTVLDLLHQAADRAALGLEAARIRDVQFQVRDSDVDFSAQRLSKFRGDLHHLVSLDDVAYLDVLITHETDTTVEALSNF